MYNVLWDETQENIQVTGIKLISKINNLFLWGALISLLSLVLLLCTSSSVVAAWLLAREGAYP